MICVRLSFFLSPPGTFASNFHVVFLHKILLVLETTINNSNSFFIFCPKDITHENVNELKVLYGRDVKIKRLVSHAQNS